MDTLVEKLESIKEKTRLLSQQHTVLKSKHQSLITENQGLKNELDAKVNMIQDLNSKIKIVKLAKNITGENTENKTELKYKINQFIREIDKCLALLNG